MKKNRLNIPGKGLMVRLPPRRVDMERGPACRYDYFSFAGGTILSQGRAVLAELPTAPALILVLAAEDVLLTTAVVPPLAASRLRAALPNLIEDRALSDVAGLHVAQAAAATSGSQTLAVVDRPWLKTVLGRFQAAGYRVAAVWPESLCVPQQGAAWSLAAIADQGVPRIWLRTGSTQSYALPGDASSASLMLKALIAQSGGSAPKLALHASREQMPLLLQLAAAAGCAAQSFEGDPLRHWFEQLANQVEDGAANQNMPRSLLQHELAGSAIGAVQWWSWRRVVLLLVALFAVQVSAMQIHWAQLRSERSALREQAMNLLRSAFPETTTILDAPLQMQRALADLRAHTGQSDPSDFTSLLGAAGSIFAAVPVNAFQGIEFGTDSNNAHGLRIRLAPGIAANPAEQNNLNQHASAAGYELRFEAAPPAAAQIAGKNGGVVASLRFKGAT